MLAETPKPPSFPPYQGESWESMPRRFAQQFSPVRFFFRWASLRSPQPMHQETDVRNQESDENRSVF
ncbi:MAG: hypothetical protein LBL72_11290 [Candidatus Accumulibacter sp.]|jgi:hypothetical protein|nr:hypothetical protein [Accumulibacter sp.]